MISEEKSRRGHICHFLKIPDVSEIFDFEISSSRNTSIQFGFIVFIIFHNYMYSSNAITVSLDSRYRCCPFAVYNVTEIILLQNGCQINAILVAFKNCFLGKLAKVQGLKLSHNVGYFFQTS